MSDGGAASDGGKAAEACVEPVGIRVICTADCDSGGSSTCSRSRSQPASRSVGFNWPHGWQRRHGAVGYGYKAVDAVVKPVVGNRSWWTIAISKIVGLPAAEPLPGRWDRMGPHLNKGRSADPSFVATGAGGCSSVRSGRSAAAPASSSPMEVQMIDEEALRAQLGRALDDSADAGSQGQPAP